MRAIERLGRMVLLGLAAPFMLAEEVRAVARHGEDVDAARSEAERARGERDEARHASVVAAHDRDGWRTLFEDAKTTTGKRERALGEERARCVKLSADLNQTQAEVSRMRGLSRDILAALSTPPGSDVLQAVESHVAALVKAQDVARSGAERRRAVNEHRNEEARARTKAEDAREDMARELKSEREIRAHAEVERNAALADASQARAAEKAANVREADLARYRDEERERRIAAEKREGAATLEAHVADECLIEARVALERVKQEAAADAESAAGWRRIAEERQALLDAVPVSSTRPTSRP